MQSFKIGNHLIGENQPVFIIAEMSANHGGKLENAIEIIRAAKRAGADAVKLQTYRADTITLNSEKEDFTLPSESPWQKSKTLYSLYEQAYMPWEWHTRLYEEAKKLDIEIFSSPFDHSAVDLLAELNSVAYKIASPEITDLPLIAKIAKLKKPVILSTGLAEKADIQMAVDVLKENGNEMFAFLKCTTAYPAPIHESNLALIPQIMKDFSCISGISDHTLGHEAVLASVALGGKIIEKHFMLDNSDETPDSFFSLSESEFTDMVKLVRRVESSLGNGYYDLSSSAQKNLRGRRSLYVANPIKAGEVISESHIKSVRPSFGLHPKYHEEILGKRVLKDLDIGDRLSLELIDFE
ncbi:pseudaminic acid synthase [Colwellia asteriadis]|uniref:Pseudaminic acid synthase n=1 Tax=Colwellia asteriadis TaxID=517723 RepID=A0ABN1L5S7_9GAMM